MRKQIKEDKRSAKQVSSPENCVGSCSTGPNRTFIVPSEWKVLALSANPRGQLISTLTSTLKSTLKFHLFAAESHLADEPLPKSCFTSNVDGQKAVTEKEKKEKAKKQDEAEKKEKKAIEEYNKVSHATLVSHPILILILIRVLMLTFTLDSPRTYSLSPLPPLHTRC